MKRGRPPYPDILTPREQEVLALLREGLTNEQIGIRLGISEHGAKYHVAEILSKLGVSSRQEAARWSRPQRVAPSLAGLLSRHLAVGALVVAGVGLIALAAGVLLMNERNGGAQTSGSKAQRVEENLPPPGVDDGPIRRIAYVEVQGEEGDIWTMNPDGSNKVQLTNDPGFEGSPAWSPDGRRISFLSRPPATSGDGPAALSVMNADGTNRHQILDDTGGAGLFVWSPDGKMIAFHSSLIGNLNVFVLDADGGNFRTLTNDNFINAGVTWTPDSRTISFSNGLGIAAIDADGTNAVLVYPVSRGAGESAEVTSDLSRAIVRTEVDRARGLFDVDLVDVPAGSKTKLLSAADEPVGFFWSPDGRRIAYVDGINGTDAIRLIDNGGSNQVTLISEQISGLFSIIGWTQDGDRLVYQRSEVVSRFEMGSRICVVAIDGSENNCFDPRFWGNQDGPSSPSLLLN